MSSNISTILAATARNGITAAKKTDSFTAADKNLYLCDTSAKTDNSFVVQLPQGAEGSVIQLWDSAGTWGTTNKNCTIRPYGTEKINSIAGDVIGNVVNVRIILVYQDATIGWAIDVTSKALSPIDLTGAQTIYGAKTFANATSLSTVNKVTITTPPTAATLTIADGATLTASATATVSGTNTGDNAVNTTCVALTAPNQTISGNIAVNGNVTGSGVIRCSATSGVAFLANAYTTAAVYANLSNNTGSMFIGAEGVAGGTLISGSSGYDGALRHNQAMNISVDNGVTKHLTISSTGLAVTGRVTSSGKLTINNAAATSVLSISSQGSTTDRNLFEITNTGSDFYCGTDSSVGTFTGSTGYASVSGTTGNTPYHLIHNNTVRATISATGLAVTGMGSFTDSGNGFGITITKSGSHTLSPRGLHISMTGCTTANPAYDLIYCADATDAKFIVGGTGNATNRNNSYGGISDQKLKTNITDARNYLDDLCKVKIRKFNFINDLDAPKQLGVVAQELETVFPGLVEGTPDRAERLSGKYEQNVITPAVKATFDEDGNELTPSVEAIMRDDLDKPIMETYLTGEVTKSVKYSVFVPMLITAIQGLAKQNERLEARLAALESK